LLIQLEGNRRSVTEQLAPDRCQGFAKGIPNSLQQESIAAGNGQNVSLHLQLNVAAKPEFETIASDLLRQGGMQSRNDFRIVLCHVSALPLRLLLQLRSFVVNLEEPASPATACRSHNESSGLSPSEPGHLGPLGESSRRQRSPILRLLAPLSN
jgi:hypothetical protein